MARRKNYRLPDIDTDGFSVKFRGLKVTDCRVIKNGKFEITVNALGENIKQIVPVTALEFYRDGMKVDNEKLASLVSA